jgi:hypothetical protein
MCTKPLSAFLFLLGVTWLSASAGTLSVDGISVGPVIKWSGGDVRAEVVTDASAGKHLGQLRYDPVVVEMPLPLAAPLVSWINDFAAGRHTAKNLVLTEIEVSGRASPVLTTLEASGAYLTGVRFPVGEATSRMVATVRLVFGVGQARLSTSSGQAGTPVRTTATVQNFRLNVVNLGGVGVFKTGAIEITLASEGSQSAAPGVAATTTGPVRLSTFIVTLHDTAAADWNAWFKDFVFNGNNDNTREKAASLEFFDGSQSTSVLHLQLGQMGIARLTRQPATSDSAATVQAELYFEQLSIAASTAAASQTSQTQPPTTPPPAEPASVPPTPTTAASDSTATPTSAPAPVAATDLPIGSTRVLTAVTNTGHAQIRPVAMAVPLASTIAVTPPDPSSATAETVALEGSNPADQGSRDPIGFPRVSGLTRLTFSGSMQKSYVQESATYASADDLRRLVDNVVKTAKAAGWEQTSHTETGEKTVDRSVNAEWNKGPIRAQMSFTDRKPGGTTITLWVAGKKSDD